MRTVLILCHCQIKALAVFTSFSFHIPLQLGWNHRFHFNHSSGQKCGRVFKKCPRKHPALSFLPWLSWKPSIPDDIVINKIEGAGHIRRELFRFKALSFGG